MSSLPSFTGRDPKLSPHFTLLELTRSQVALRHGIPNVPGPDEYVALGALCRLLEQIRARFGSPLSIRSGYRSPEVNRLVGGAPTSQHVLGQAADFVMLGFPNSTVVEIMAKGDIVYDQLIGEGGDAGWIHISIAIGRPPRRQALRARFTGPGAVEYSPW